MTFVMHAPPVNPLAPIVAALARVRAQRGEAPVHGITPSLLAPPEPAAPQALFAPRDLSTPHPGTLEPGTLEPGALPGDQWVPATDLIDGHGLDTLLTAAQQRWRAAPHAAAALAFKSYAYWLALPAVVGYASARRVPLVTPENVRVRLHGGPPFLELGLVRPAVAALTSDPVTALGGASVLALPDDAALLAHLRTTLLDLHLSPLLEHLHDRVRVGHRTLLGSVASGIAYALVRSADALPGGVVRTADEILTALGVDDLVEIGADLSVQRRTCCLAFTLPEPKYCSGCCIPAARS